MPEFVIHLMEYEATTYVGWQAPHYIYYVHMYTLVPWSSWFRGLRIKTPTGGGENTMAANRFPFYDLQGQVTALFPLSLVGSISTRQEACANYLSSLVVPYRGVRIIARALWSVCRGTLNHSRPNCP